MSENDVLPTLHEGEPPLRGVLRERSADFRVDEIPAYPPSGDGDHLYIHFEKVDLDTPEAVRRIAGVLGIDPRACGWAGLKDRRAITTQWASFLFGEPRRLEGAAIEGVRVLGHARHRNKLKPGHLRANRFDLLVRGASAERLDEVQRRLHALGARGVPNYFGEQRFGRDAGNLAAARAWLIEGGRAPRDRFKRKLFVSTLQSALFNELCAARVRVGALDGARAGDLMRKEETGGLFVSDGGEVDRERAARFEISATGPMFGARMRWPEGEVRAEEEACLARSAVTTEVLERFRSIGEGTRRPYRVRLDEPSVREDEDGVRVGFTLPSGAYATVVMRELVKAEP